MTPSYSPPTPDEDTPPLPEGWVAEKDPSTGRIYYVDTLALNPQATWVDPRTNPALYASHDPEMGVTASHQTATHAAGAQNVNGHGRDVSPVPHSTPRQLPSLRVVENTAAAAPLPSAATSAPPPTPKVYPEYSPRGAPSPIMSLTGAIVAGAMMYRATKQ